MSPIDLKNHVRPVRPAFTLVEMLVVIAIMSILMTAGSIGLSGMGGKGVTSGVASAESLFDEARATAKGKNLRACVLVAKNLTNSPGENLRRLVVATEEVNPDGTAKAPNDNQPMWELSSRGVVLPDQVFFSQNYSQEKDAGGTGPLEEMSDSKIKNVKAALKGDFYIYKFSSQGTRIPPSASPNGVVYPVSFVIGAGSRSVNSPNAKPKVTSAGKQDFGGFMIWRNGGTSTFRGPKQISNEIEKLVAGKEF